MIFLFAIASCSVFHSALAQTNSTVNTFQDPKTGISFKYPSDWHIASQDYTNMFFGNSAPTNSLSSSSPSNTSTTTPVVLVLPESLNGATLVILSEVLPFPMSIDKYFEISKNHFPTIHLSNPIPASIANLNGLKYTLSLPDGLTQTQISFIKDSKAFVVGYTLGTEQTKDIADINSMINSLSFNSNG